MRLRQERPPPLDQRRMGAAGVVPEAAQRRERGGVEGAGGHLVAQAEPAGAGAQLGRSPTGERQREDPAGIDRTLRRVPRDAPREHPGLARAGSRDDAERIGGGGDRVALLVGETVEERGDVGHRRTLPIRSVVSGG